VDDLLRQNASEQMPLTGIWPQEEIWLFRFGASFCFARHISADAFFTSLILDKAFDSSPPEENLGDILHLCCCLSCPHHARPGADSKLKAGAEAKPCILQDTQRWPHCLTHKKQNEKQQQTDEKSIIQHWHNLLTILPKRQQIKQRTTIFLHGLGSDLTMTWPWTPEEKDQKFQDSESHAAYMRKALQKKAIIRLTFTFDREEKGTQSVQNDTACIQFHRKVKPRLALRSRVIT